MENCRERGIGTDRQDGVGGGGGDMTSCVDICANEDGKKLRIRDRKKEKIKKEEGESLKNASG